MEKGLAALDSLYELRNVIPGLIETSDLEGQEGALLITVLSKRVADPTSLEYLLVAPSPRSVETVHQRQPTYTSTRDHLPTATTPLHPTIIFAVDLPHL